MKTKSKICVGVISSLILVSVLAITLMGCSGEKYFEKISKYKFWANKASEAVAQTHIYDLVNEHMANQNGKDKKVLVLGFDGMRADALTNIRNSGVKNGGDDVYSGHNDNAKYSAVNHILDNGGKAYVGYCGGEKGKETEQATSTAPGWAAIQTGSWGVENGITDNNMVKNMNKKTFLLKYAEEQKLNTAFCASWAEHFEKTYKPEIDYVKKNNISMKHLQSKTDQETHANVKKCIDENMDMIFAIYEAPDHNGHGTGFTNDNPNYVNGVRNTDNLFYEILMQVESRPNYENEDWLIVLTNDHGGMDLSHGMQKPEARTTFIITNKTIDAKYFSKNYDGYKDKN